MRPAVWVLHLALPLLGLWLLVARSDLDYAWEHHVAHFWVVLTTAIIDVALAAFINAEAARRRDARLFLVSLAFITCACFLAVHALATPGLLVAGRNAGFDVSTPTGLLLAAALCAWSAVEFSADGSARLLAASTWLRAGVAAATGLWLVTSLTQTPPLARPLTETEANATLRTIMGVGAALFLVATLRYWALHKRRPSVMLVSTITAFALLAEALVAATFSRNWHLSWWEWHLLMMLAFAFVGYSAYVQWAREGSPAGLFQGIALPETVREIRRGYDQAIQALVDAIAQAADAADASVEPVAASVAARFGLTERQRDVLVQAAQALAHERDQIRRQGAIVALGREASVIRSEENLLGRVAALAVPAFGRDELKIMMLQQGRLDAPAALAGPASEALTSLRPVEAHVSDHHTLAFPLTVKGKPAGVVSVTRPAVFADRDRSLYEAFASQLAIAVENARLYRQIDGLFRSYISPDVATSLLADPERAALGGAVAEVTVLMADLIGFTPFSERTPPPNVVGMLNTYYGCVVPIVLAEGGTVVQFVGDALMAIFNAPVPQPDHARRAARVALEAQRQTGGLAAAHPGWPRFRVGINTGPALVGNIGSDQMRNFTAIGDTTNLAARLEAAAGAGEVVVSGATLGQLGADTEALSLGALQLKGKSAPVAAYRLVRLGPADSPNS